LAQLLLVDDDPDQVEIRQLIMEQAGHDVRTASSPDKALAAFDATPCDVVLMDLRLPHSENGIQLIRDLRERSASVPILVLSGWPEDLANAPEAAMVTGFLRKPVRSSYLIELVSRVA
jgi:DNA-binding NtrC family response regulator